MRTLNLLTLAAATATLLALPANSQAAGGIAGSAHDFSSKTWNTRAGVCSTCHSAHNTDLNQIAPLWSHATSGATFTPYSSPSMQATPGLPSGVSLACLSCHDGTVAINQGIGGLSGTAEFIDPAAKIGPDLHNTHPISFDYTSALAISDPGLEDPVTYKIGDAKTKLSVTTPPVPASWSGTSLTGKSIKQALLVGDKMECSSCHDIHKIVGSAPTSGIMVKISGTDAALRGSLICRTCHIK
jgi:hypothetical protein